MPSKRTKLTREEFLKHTGGKFIQETRVTYGGVPATYFVLPPNVRLRPNVVSWLNTWENVTFTLDQKAANRGIVPCQAFFVGDKCFPFKKGTKAA